MFMHSFYYLLFPLHQTTRLPSLRAMRVLAHNLSCGEIWPYWTHGQRRGMYYLDVVSSRGWKESKSKLKLCCGQNTCDWLSVCTRAYNENKFELLVMNDRKTTKRLFHALIRACEYVRTRPHCPPDEHRLTSELVIHWNKRVVGWEGTRAALTMYQQLLRSAVDHVLLDLREVA